jgi:DNA-binding response OmpR family regulator
VKTILVVEDEALVGMELEEGLTSLGYLVPEVVTRGDEVLAAMGRVHPDLVLMDIRIGGGLDGIQAAVLLRRESEVPLIFLTAYSDPQTLHRAAEARPQGFLIKPFGAKELAEEIKATLRGGDKALPPKQQPR